MCNLISLWTVVLNFVGFMTYGKSSTKLKTVLWLRVNLSKRVGYTHAQLWDPESKHTIFFCVEHDISGSTFNEKIIDHDHYPLEYPYSLKKSYGHNV
jgi:hypothetical protein